MRFFKHIGLQPAWNMRAGLGTIFICAEYKNPLAIACKRAF
jgi:hypothetical protein